MKTPCELVVWHVLPQIRRELARQLVFKHGLTQARAARLLGMSDPTISNYVRSKDGGSDWFHDQHDHEEFYKEVELVAQRIIHGSNVVAETCQLCEMVKRTKVLIDLYNAYDDENTISTNVCKLHRSDRKSKK